MNATGISKFILGPSETTPLEKRVYISACFVAFAVSVCSAVFDFMFGMIPIVKIVTMLSVAIFSTQYFLSRKTSYENKYILLFSILVFLSVSWFINQGSQGSVIFLFILTSIAFVTLSETNEIWITTPLIYLNIILLYFTEHYHPELILPYASPYSKAADILSTIAYTIFFANLMFMVVKTEHKQEKTKLAAQKKLELALRESEKRFREIIEEVSEIAIQGYDERRRVTFWNKASEQLYLYSQKEALGAKLEDLIIPAAMKEEVQHRHYQWMVHDKKIPAGELTLMDKNGNDVYVFSSHVMHETQYGKEMFCIDLDMNPIKFAEKEKKQLETQLLQSQKMEAIGTLAGGIAHDFNNIIQAISGYTEILISEKTGTDPDIDSLNEILNASERAGELVSKLLFFSRKAPIQKKALNINHEILQAVKMLEKTIPKMVHIELSQTEALWNVMGDPVQMEQIILNLGKNSSDAMPDGGTIQIQTRNITLKKSLIKGFAKASPGEYVRIRVSDTGHGMDKTITKKIFEPFFTTKEQGKGTGLGLSSVYGIVKSHSGYIICESDLDQGTVFTIYLPAASPPADTSDPKAMFLPVSGTETILIVDDEPSVNDLLCASLSKAGFTTLPAKNGEEALNIFQTGQPRIDLIILDLNMPGMGGYKCLKKLLILDPRIKVIIASGYSEEFNLSFETGASGYIEKPFRLNEILMTVRRVLDK